MREKSDCCAGGGFFRIDFPGTGMVTADDEGGHDEPDDEDEAIEDVVVRQNNGTLTNVRIQLNPVCNQK
jgi:hypothetical protein